MKTIVVTFNVPDHLADEAQEYAGDALQVLGGAYTPEHPYYHVRKSIENINAYVGTQPPKLRPKHAVIGQRCVVKGGGASGPSFIGIITAIIHGGPADVIEFTVRHSVLKLERTYDSRNVELLPVQ